MPAHEEDENQSFFSKLKHSYLNFVENLREKGLPAPHLLVPLVALIIIVAAAYLLSPGLFVEKKAITLTVKDNLGRPVPQASVVLYSGDQQTIDTKTTDASGRVQFEGAPVNGGVRVSAEGFRTAEAPLSRLLSQSTPSVSLQSTAPQTKNIEVRVVDENNQPVEGAFVTLTFSDGSLTPQAVTNAGGIALVAVQQTQLDAGTVSVDAVQFKTTQQPVAKEALEAGLLITVRLEAEEAPVADKDTLTVSVSSASGPVRGARVVLIDQFTDAEQAGERTSADGTAVFEDIALGSVFDVRITAVGYAPFREEFTFTENTQTLEATLQARQAGQGSATLTVVDEQSTPVSGAVVNFFEANSNTLLASGETDENGIYSTELGAGVNAYATAYIDGFLPGFVEGLAAGASATLALSQAVAGSTTSLTVQVREDGFPASGAEVALYRSGGFFLGLPQLTAGAQGMVNVTIPAKFDGQAYRVFARASKASLSGESDLVDVASDPLSLTVDLIALPANVTVTLNDISNNQMLANGAVEAQVDGHAVSTCSVEQGSCTLVVSANKPFHIQATAPGYITYTSSQTGFTPGSKNNVTLELFPLSLAQGATVNFLGLFDSNGAKVREVLNGETYNARFAVTLPQNVENAGFYLRGGDEADALASVASITSFDSNGAPFVQASTKFDSSSTSCLTGETIASSTPLKWVYLSFPRGFVGTRELVAKVEVARTATSADSVVLSYRAFGFKDNLPLLAPSDTALLEELRSRIDSGQRLQPEDTCSAQSFTQRVPLSQQVLQCIEQGDAELCYKVALSDSTSRGSVTSFQPALGRDVTLELEILSTVAIDSTAIRTEAFRVSNARQTLTSRSISFADVNVPFITLPNRKGKLTFTLTPLLSTQSAAILILLRSGDAVYELPLTLSITGTNTFSVSASPQRIPAASESRVSVLVRDRNANPVSDATVSFYECAGSPFSGSDPNEIIGDGSSDNGANGRYRTKLNPTGLGEIGVRVERDGFRTFENCLITVEGRNFISVDPESLEFTGSSQDAAPKQVTVTNSLSEPIRVSAGLNCGGDAVPLSVFPSAFTIDPSSDSTASVKVIPNVTANTQCILTFNGRAGSYKSVAEVPVSINVNCPGCTSAVPATGSAAKPLPSVITLFVHPVLLQDAVSLPLALPADPTCRLDGFRINFAGIYSSVPRPPIPSGVLQGLPQPNLWNCAACGSADAKGDRECAVCQQVELAAWSCGACRPINAGAPTSSSLPGHDRAICGACSNPPGVQRAYSHAAPLAYRGYPVPYPPGVNRYGFDPTVGANYQLDYGPVGNVYDSRFALQPPGLPGSSRFLDFRGYQHGYGFSRESIRDALQVEECSKEGITIAADFSYLGRVFPGTGTLFVTLPDGSRKQVRVIVASPGTGGGVGFEVEPGYYEQKCGASTFSFNSEIDSDFKTKQNITAKLTCDIAFSEFKFSIKTKDNQEIGANNCQAGFKDNEFHMSCDFSRDDKAKQALTNEHVLFTDIEVTSTRDPDAKLAIKAVLTYFAGVAQAPPGALATPAATTPGTTTTAPASGVTTPAPTQAPSPGPGHVAIIVCRDSERTCTQQNKLCGKDVTVSTPLKVQYRFPTGDTANERKIEIKQGSNVQQTFAAADLTTATGTKQHTPAQVGAYSYEASTKVGDATQTDACNVNVVVEPIYITQIAHVVLHRDPVASTDVAQVGWPNVFPDNVNKLKVEVQLDEAALRTTYGRKTLKLVKTFVCKDDPRFQLYQIENLVPSTTVATAYTRQVTSPQQLSNTGERKEPFASLLFTFCQNRANDLTPGAIDHDIPYLVKVEIVDPSPPRGAASNVLIEKYEGPNSAAVDVVNAQPFNVLFYPEAPLAYLAIQPTPPRNAVEMDVTPLDPCGRLQGTAGSPQLSAIYVRRKPAGANNFVYVKSNEPISPGDTLEFTACIGQLQSGAQQSTEFNAELKTTSGGSILVPLASCQFNGKNFCTATASASMPSLINRDNLLAQGVNIGAGFKIKAKEFTAPATSGSQLTSERYFCKRWPNGQNDNCSTQGQAVQLQFSFGPVPRVISQHCIADPWRGGNPNILLCDVDATTVRDIPLPNGMHFQVTGLQYDTDDKEIKYKVYYQGQGVPGSVQGKTLDCDNNAIGDEAEVDLDDTQAGHDVQGDVGESCWGDDLSLRGATLLVPVRVVRILGPREKPFGRQAPGTTTVVRVRINTLFGANEEWLREYFQHSEETRVIATSSLASRAPRILRRPEFHSSPRIPMSDRSLLGSGNPGQKDGLYILGIGDAVKLYNGDVGIVRFLGINSQNQYLFEVRGRNQPEKLDCGSNAELGLYIFEAGVAAVAVGFVCADTLGLACVGFTAAGAGLAGSQLGRSFTQAQAPELLAAYRNEVATCREGSPDVLVKPLKRVNVPSSTGGQLPGVCVIITTDDKQSEVEQRLGSLSTSICDSP